VACVCCNRTSDPRTSYAMMTSIVVFHWLEAFAPEVAFGADSLRGESPPPRCGLASAPSGLEFHRTTDSALQKIRRYVADVVTKRMCVGLTCEGAFRFGDLCGLRTASPTVASYRRGSIPMSRPCDDCEEIPGKVSPSLFGIEPSLCEF
jgi:hypothetical protein